MKKTKKRNRAVTRKPAPAPVPASPRPIEETPASLAIAVGAERNKKAPAWVERVLKIFGQNPYGENLYRIVWSEAVVTVRDGAEILEYGNLKPQWILEKWLSPEEDTGMTEAEWEQKTRDPETGELIIGPYPSRGTFNHSYSFGESTPLCVTTVNLICALIHAGKARYNNAQRKAAILAAQERADKAWRDRMDAEYQDAQDSFKGEYVARGKTGARKRKPEDIKIEFTAEDLPLRQKKSGFQQLSNSEMEKLCQ